MARAGKDVDFTSFEVIPDAVIVVDRTRRIKRANEHAEKLFGYARGGLIGLMIEMLLPERFRKRHPRFVGEFFQKPVPRPMGKERELYAVKRDGREFPAEIAIGPTPDGSHTVAVIRDITPLVNTRARLSESEAESHELDRSFASTPIGLCYLDEELRYVRVNEWLAELNGLSTEEHIGRKLADVVPEVARGSETQFRHVLETGEAIINGLVEAITPAHPTTPRTYMHNYFPDRSANGNVVGVFCVVQDVTEAKKELAGALAKIEVLKDRLQAENVYFQEEIKSSHNFEDIIGTSARMMATIYKVEQVAETDATVLLLGETGTGKELLARAVHSRSRRSKRPLIKVDCTTLPPGLVESELFGHEKGAFTGAHQSRAGRFELADKGTIFLDEIGELSTELQAKLLQVIQEGTFHRLGGRRARKVDVRVIAATNRDLGKEMSAGRFRSDLYYRLNVFPIEIPPLRDRREDIPLLTSYFVSRRSRVLGKNIVSVSKATLTELMAYDWPGNVRELENTVERAIILSRGKELTLPEPLRHEDAPRREGQEAFEVDLKDVERKLISKVLTESGWKIKGDGNAATRLGLKPSTLRSRMKRLGIERPA